jgi:hypothetical protein
LKINQRPVVLVGEASLDRGARVAAGEVPVDGVAKINGEKASSRR